MPAAKTHKPGVLDTWGRRNRKLQDKGCVECGVTFRPKRHTTKYCSRECAWKNNGGHNRKEYSWWVDAKGYIQGRIWIDENTQIRVKQHRWNMEKYLGRKLRDDEDVHHINGDKRDNRIENLQVIDHGEHASLTNLSRDYSGYKKPKYSEVEMQRRVDFAKDMHADGVFMTPQKRAALAKANGETT